MKRGAVPGGFGRVAPAIMLHTDSAKVQPHQWFAADIMGPLA